MKKFLKDLPFIFIKLAIVAVSGSLIIKLKESPYLQGVDQNTLTLILYIAFAIISLIVYYLTSILTDKLNIKQNARKCFYWLLEKTYQKIKKIHPKVSRSYLPRERDGESYRQAITEQIRKSHRVYLRLLNAHTMFYDERENFISDILENLPFKQLRGEKDIKIQLLDESTKYYSERASKFVDKMNKEDHKHKCPYPEYLERCKKIKKHLEEMIAPERISFYKRKYLWRLLIFDDVIFISTYSDSPELIEGHLSTAYAFTRNTDPYLFEGYLDEFLSLYNMNNISEKTVEDSNI